MWKLYPSNRPLRENELDLFHLNRYCTLFASLCNKHRINENALNKSRFNKQDGVVYKIPCECGKVYIGETGRSMHERIKEHHSYIRLARTQTSAVSEHANRFGHYPLWNEVKFIDRDPD